MKDNIDVNFNSIRKECYTKAINNMDGLIPSAELAEITNSLRNEQQIAASSCVSGNSSFSTMTAMSGGDSQIIDTQIAFAKMQLLYAQYCNDAQEKDNNSLIILYKSVTMAQPQWEEGHYCFALYCDKVISRYEDSLKTCNALGDREEKILQILQFKAHVIKSLSESLKHGVKHVHRSLPRLLTLWFDLGTELASLSSSRTKGKIIFIFIIDSIITHNIKFNQ